MREVFQKASVGGTSATNAGGGGSVGGGVDDEDPDPDDGSPPSGPDAGGGEADAMLPAAEWELQASSEKYTLSQVDQDRCGYVAHAYVFFRCVVAAAAATHFSPRVSNDVLRSDGCYRHCLEIPRPSFPSVLFILCVLVCDRRRCPMRATPREMIRLSGGGVIPPALWHVPVCVCACAGGLFVILVKRLFTHHLCDVKRSGKQMWNRCNALSTWVMNKAPHLWLKPSAEAKVWVQDLFRRPQSGPRISEAEVSVPHASD